MTEPTEQYVGESQFREINPEPIEFLTGIVTEYDNNIPLCSAVIAESERFAINLEYEEYLLLWKVWACMAEDTTLCDHRMLAYIILKTDMSEVAGFLRKQRRMELRRQQLFLGVSIHLEPPWNEQNLTSSLSDYQQRRSEWDQRWVHSKADDFPAVLTAYVVAKKTFLSALSAWLYCHRTCGGMEPIIDIFQRALKNKDDCADYALWLHSHLRSQYPILAQEMFNEACEIEWLFFDSE